MKGKDVVFQVTQIAQIRQYTTRPQLLGPFPETRRPEYVKQIVGDNVHKFW